MTNRYRERPQKLDAKPDAVFSSEALVFENGEATYRVNGNGAGWTVSDDGAHVTLMGGLCDNATGGAYASINFEFGCVQLPPLPPIKPPQ